MFKMQKLKKFNPDRRLARKAFRMLKTKNTFKAPKITKAV